MTEDIPSAFTDSDTSLLKCVHRDQSHARFKCHIPHVISSCWPSRKTQRSEPIRRASTFIHCMLYVRVCMHMCVNENGRHRMYISHPWKAPSIYIFIYIYVHNFHTMMMHNSEPKTGTQTDKQKLQQGTIPDVPSSGSLAAPDAPAIARLNLSHKLVCHTVFSAFLSFFSSYRQRHPPADSSRREPVERAPLLNELQCNDSLIQFENNPRKLLIHMFSFIESFCDFCHLYVEISKTKILNKGGRHSRHV